MMRAERSAISTAGSSKELVLRARAASACRRPLVEWIPAPTAAARRAKSDWAVAVEEAAESGFADEVIEGGGGGRRAEEVEGPKEAEERLSFFLFFFSPKEKRRGGGESEHRSTMIAVLSFSA